MRDPFESLTDRQMKIAELVASGCRDREIAQITGATENTIGNRLVEIFDKVGCESRHQLAVLWWKDRPHLNSYGFDDILGRTQAISALHAKS